MDEVVKLAKNAIDAVMIVSLGHSGAKRKEEFISTGSG